MADSDRSTLGNLGRGNRKRGSNVIALALAFTTYSRLRSRVVGADFWPLVQQYSYGTCINNVADSKPSFARSTMLAGIGSDGTYEYTVREASTYILLQVNAVVRTGI